MKYYYKILIIILLLLSMLINVQEDKNLDIGQDSSLSFLLLAPNSQVSLRKQVTFRGQILAREIRVGEDSIISRVEDERKFSIIQIFTLVFSDFFGKFLNLFRATLLQF